jgi:hypothetical protein
VTAVEHLTSDLPTAEVRARLARVPQTAGYRLRGGRAIAGRSGSDGRFVIWEIAGGPRNPVLDAEVTVLDGPPTRVELRFGTAWRRHLAWLTVWPLVAAGLFVWVIAAGTRPTDRMPHDPVTLGLTFLLIYAFIAGWMTLLISALAWRRGPDERRFVVARVRTLLT